MVNVTAADFKAFIINDSTISAANAEGIIDFAANLLALFVGADLPNMTGVSGSKTLSCEGREAAAIYLVAKILYREGYKGQPAIGISGLSITPQQALGNPIVLQAVKDAANQLKEMDVGIV